jgi:plasmid replication initiation protein
MSDAVLATIHRPKVPDDLSSIVKPEELVDVIEMSPLTLQDRRMYNLLLGNAWNRIMSDKEHVISRQELTRYVDSHNQDIEGSLRRLMAAIVVIRIRHNKNGKPSTRQMQLLAENDIEERGPITYRFPDALVKIIKDTQIFARLHTEVMFQLSSKYSLALYEFLQKRKNMQFTSSETLTVEEVRGILGVGTNKLKSFGHLNDKAIKPSLEEVSFLTEYEITAEPLRTGRSVTHIRFSWKKKTDIGAQIAAVEELERSKVGRKSRQQQTVEVVETITYSQKSDFKVSSILLEKAREIALEANTGWDIYAIESEFYDYIRAKGMPNNPEGAFIGFVKKKVQKAP